MNTKPWYTSKTIWLAIVQGLAGVLAAVFSADPSVQSIGWLAIVKSVLDFGLRFLTGQAIGPTNLPNNTP